jgi:hypothetical protein
LRPGLANVHVTSLWRNPEALGPKFIILAADIPGEQTYPFTSGNTKHETFSFNGLCAALVPGAAEANALDAMGQAMGLLGEIEACLREDPRISGTAFVSELTEFTHNPAFSDTGRMHMIDFTIRVQARLVSS